MDVQKRLLLPARLQLAQPLAAPTPSLQQRRKARVMLGPHARRRLAWVPNPATPPLCLPLPVPPLVPGPRSRSLMCHLRPGEDLRAELKDTLRPEVRSAGNNLLPTGQPAALLAATNGSLLAATNGCLCSSTGATAPEVPQTCWTPPRLASTIWLQLLAHLLA